MQGMTAEMTCSCLIQLVFYKKMWFIGVEVEQETFLSGAPLQKKNLLLKNVLHLVYMLLVIIHP